jgi:uncharacterized protein (TIGR00297 family)
MPPLLIGFLLALLISALAYAVRALDFSGAVAATALGALVFGLGGLDWALVLIAFFVSSSLLSRLAKQRKSSLQAVFSKGGRRDAAQVLANGGIAGGIVLLHALFPQAGVLWAAFAGALAAVNADTWATELGVLSRTPPRLITSGKPVERGTSGGISLIGTLAAAGGALFVGVIAALLTPLEQSLAFVFIAGISGLLGSLVDSLLGATLQAIYHCPACSKFTERHPFHTCGTKTSLARGLVWMNNDVVNALCSLAGALVAAGLFLWMGG